MLLWAWNPIKCIVLWISTHFSLKYFWRILGMILRILCTFEKIYINPHMVESLMFLVPKVDNTHTFKKNWPISLCNLISKLVSKVLVNCFRLMLCEIMSPLQSNFILGRGTIYNVILRKVFLYHFISLWRNKIMLFISWMLRRLMT